MTLKEFFDLRMIVLLISQGILLFIMTKMSPLGTLDARLFYSDLEGSLYLQSLSLAALHNYRFVEYIDLFFIYKYTRTIVLALMRLYPKNKIWLIALIPAVFDLTETLSILKALHSANRALPLPGLGAVTCTKWLVAAAVVTFILICLRKLKGRAIFHS